MLTIKRTLMTLLTLGFLLSGLHSQLCAKQADGGDVSILPIFVEELNDSNFQQTIAQGIVIVDYHAKWCQPCKLFAPMFEEVAKEHRGKLTFGKLDIDEAPNARRHSRISSVPTVIIFKDGKEIKRNAGVFSNKDKFIDFIKSAG
ncbi:MAG: thioredoxin [Waddliaceae bacterium]